VTVTGGVNKFWTFLAFTSRKQMVFCSVLIPIVRASAHSFVVLLSIEGRRKEKNSVTTLTNKKKSFFYRAPLDNNIARRLYI